MQQPQRHGLGCSARDASPTLLTKPDCPASLRVSDLGSWGPRLTVVHSCRW